MGVNSNRHASELSDIDQVQVEIDNKPDDYLCLNSTFGKINNTAHNTSTTSRIVTRQMKNYNEDSATLLLEITDGTETPSASY